MGLRANRRAPRGLAISPGNYTRGQSTRDPASQWYHEMLSNDDLLGSINNADEGEGDGRIGPEMPIMIQVLGDG
jgi:hypothetical protein